MTLIVTRCATCQALVEDGSRFCDECGTPLRPGIGPDAPARAAGEADATRLLAAAALTKLGVRTSIRKWMEEPNRSTPPEIGVDLDLVARVAAFSERRARRYTYAFGGLALLTLVGLGLASVILVTIALAATAALMFVRQSTERDWVLTYFQRDRFDRAAIEERFTAPLTPAEERAVPPADGNVTVYSGFSPFVGAGLEMGGWSFAIATDKAKEHLAPIPPQSVSVRELYEAVTARLSMLHLPDLDQRDHFFVHGLDVHEHGSLLPNKYRRPVAVLAPDVLERCSFGSDPHVRHYRWMRVADWRGDIVVSCFLRCYLRGPTLFVEFKRYLLTPLQQSVRAIDDVAPLPLAGLIGHAILCIVLSPFRLFGAIIELLGYASEWWDDLWDITGRRRRKMIDRTARWDYGATTSVRQMFASGEYVRYFQRADTDSYEKTLEKEILNTLVDFLDERGVDTSDLKERQSTILNHGVIVQNGNIQAGSMAVGTGAQSVQKTLTNVVSKVTRKQQGAA